jgi:hypothetical protein
MTGSAMPTPSPGTTARVSRTVDEQVPGTTAAGLAPKAERGRATVVGDAGDRLLALLALLWRGPDGRPF